MLFFEEVKKLDKTNDSFFKIICEEVTPFEKVIHGDRNFGTFEE